MRWLGRKGTEMIKLRKRYILDDKDEQLDGCEEHERRR